MRPNASLSAAVLGLSLFVVSAPSAVAAGPRLSRTELSVVRSIDARRAARGLHALRPSRALSRAADYHSHEMLASDYFAHSSADGASFASRLRHFTRARRLGEDLAWLTRCGHGAARRVVGMWMRSPVHRAVLLARGFRRVGVGIRTGRLGSRHACVVTADFAR